MAPTDPRIAATSKRDPFDSLRATRALAPHDPRLNDLRWLTGESLCRLHGRAMPDGLRAASYEPRIHSGYAPHDAPPPSEVARHAREKLHSCEQLVGPAAWPILVRIVIERGSVSDCRSLAPEVITPWRADAVITDRLRVALDRLGPTLGVTSRSRK